MAEDRFVKRVSITAKKQPLSFVLNQISQSTGYTFVYDQDWSDLSVTVFVKNLTIDKVLRKILANQSSAIQYQENGRVIINIYENSDSSPTYVEAPIERAEIENVYINPRVIDGEEESDASELAEDSDITEVESPVESDQQETEANNDEELNPDIAENLDLED
jgi:hypothetical protein